MAMTRYQTGQKQIKRVRESEEGIAPEIIRLTERQSNGDTLVPGIKDIKLKHWFPGLDVEAYKLRLWRTHDKQIMLPYGLDLRRISAVFAEPSSMDLNAFSIPGYNGEHRIKRVLSDIGIEIDESTKTPKRLKRGLLVACIAGASDIEIMITPNDALPEPFIDGCFLINLATAKRMMPKVKFKAYDTVQASLAWSEGLAKGTAILMPNLVADCIVQECNVKREVKFKSNPKPLLTIEQIHHARIPCTDLQTIANLNAHEAMRKVFDQHMTELEEIGGNPEAADRWYQDEFQSHDWYRAALRAHLNEGKPMPTTKPPLSRAKEAGIERVSSTPILKQLAYIAASKALDMRGLKARFSKGEAVAGKMVPDVSRIDHTGHLKDSDVALGENEITVPAGKYSIPDGTPVVCTRNPNAWREFCVKVVKDREQFRSRTATMLSLHDCTNKGANDRTMFEDLGGADQDDEMSVWADQMIIQAALRSEREAVEHDIPYVDLEGYIDAAVQDAAGYSLDLGGQMALAAKEMPLHLGQIVNFFLNLKMVKAYEWYKKAAAAKDIKELRKVWDEYNSLGPELCFYTDIFCPEEPDEFDPHARVPRNNGEYIPHVEVLTDMGDVLRDFADRFEEILIEEEQSDILHAGNKMWSIDSILWLKDQAKHDAAKTRAIVLEWAWKYLTCRNPIQPLNGDVQWMLEGFSRSSEELNWKKREWGKLCGRLLTGEKDKDRQIVAYLAFLVMGPERRWDKSQKRYQEGRFGIDRILWNATLNEKGEEIEGVPEIWAELIAELEQK